MEIDYKLSNSDLRVHMIDFKDQTPETNEFFVLDILDKLQHFDKLDAEQQDSFLLQLHSTFSAQSSDFLNSFDKTQIISCFISNFISLSQCSCSIFFFLQFFSEWTNSHDVENESFSVEKETLSFLLFHSIQNPSFDINIIIYSLTILLNIINDSKIMRNNLIEDCLIDESQLQLFISMVIETKNQLIAIITFRIFNVILKLEEISNINFYFVIENFFYPSLSNLFFDFPNECIEFVSSYLRKMKVGKKRFLSDLISQIPFPNIYQSIHEFDEGKSAEFLSFLRSLIDNNDWPNDLHVNINFDSILPIIKTQESSFIIQRRFCELLISYFSNSSLYDIDYDYEPLFNYLYLMINGDFRLLDYVLCVYHAIFVSNQEISFFNPLISISQNIDSSINFFIDFLESDSIELSKKAFQIILTIIYLMYDFDYLSDAEQIKSTIKNVLFSNRFDLNDNENIKIIQETCYKLFPYEFKMDQ